MKGEVGHQSSWRATYWVPLTAFPICQCRGWGQHMTIGTIFGIKLSTTSHYCKHPMLPLAVRQPHCCIKVTDELHLPTQISPTHPRNDLRSMRLYQKIQISYKSQIHKKRPNAMEWHQKYQNQFRILSTKSSIAMRWQHSSKCTRHQPTLLD